MTRSVCPLVVLGAALMGCEATIVTPGDDDPNGEGGGGNPNVITVGGDDDGDGDGDGGAPGPSGGQGSTGAGSRGCQSADPGTVAVATEGPYEAPVECKEAFGSFNIYIDPETGLVRPITLELDEQGRLVVFSTNIGSAQMSDCVLRITWDHLDQFEDGGECLACYAAVSAEIVFNHALGTGTFDYTASGDCDGDVSGTIKAKPVFN